MLHLSLAEKPTWELHNGTAVTTISARTALKRQAIVGAGDSLFADTPSQTWL